MFKITGLFLLVVILTSAHLSAQTSNSEKQAAAEQLLSRILPVKARQHFEVKIFPESAGEDFFELSSENGKIVLAGSKGLSVASALNYYLEHYANCQVSWNGSNLNLPDPLPQLTKKEKHSSPYTYRYYLNYCTFNYTMSWWDWPRWEKEIDWMALHGINIPLALTGQNMIWRRVYHKLGFSDKDLKGFFSGPAYFNWFWMGNLDGWGGPLPIAWMESHEKLQKKILQRERELGMTPVLPAFTGHVPPGFQQKFPEAKLKKTEWSGFNPVNILDPEDPMFLEIGRLFMEEQQKAYGTDHFYSADTFNENQPPTNDSSYLSKMSRQVYNAMAVADTQAIWIMQGWLFHFQKKFWQPTQIKALLNAVPDNRMLLLDLWSEQHPVWEKTEAYYGKPWLWCMLHNFGGNISMFGRMDEVAATPASLLYNKKAGKLSGIGLTPEAIEQNPVMYKLMLENVWRDRPVDLPEWISAYVISRYGVADPNAIKAWRILQSTVYNAVGTDEGPESIITARPTFATKTTFTSTRKGYDTYALLPAWDLLLQSADALKSNEGFRYDLTDLTRQVLANYADSLQKQFAAAYERKDEAGFRNISATFLQVMRDMELLLASHPDFLLGKWIEDARRWGTNKKEKDLYERNARNQITLWGDKNSSLHEYACKQWSGMIADFYLPRWVAFFNQVEASFKSGEPLSQARVDSMMRDWECAWVHTIKKYKTKAAGNCVEIAQQLHVKYRQQIDKPRR
ncbi:MAG: alpha-N-acetylglucosaminidase [Citrobacter freundii]|nr:MAG: alpha-N-acetylglucosaminidase [Citrobacter freundii]